jgi:hypothetical protein
VAAFVQALLNKDLYEPQGVAVALHWLNALLALDQCELDEVTVNDTLPLADKVS